MKRREKRERVAYQGPAFTIEWTGPFQAKADFETRLRKGTYYETS
jgi:hypothetical protein